MSAEFAKSIKARELPWKKMNTTVSCKLMHAYHRLKANWYQKYIGPYLVRSSRHSSRTHARTTLRAPTSQKAIDGERDNYKRTVSTMADDGGGEASVPVKGTASDQGDSELGTSMKRQLDFVGSLLQGKVRKTRIAKCVATHNLTFL